MIYEIALLAAGVTIFLNYCIGKPGGEFSPHEIFSRYTVWLSIRRLKKAGLMETYHKQFQESINSIHFYAKQHEYITLKNDYHKVLYNAAEPFFTWERAVGMCSVCTGFWISLIVGLCFTFNFVALITIIVTSHIAIRIVNKIL